MVKRKKTSKARAKTVAIRGHAYVCRPTKASKAKYKKCLLTAIRGTKIVSRKGAVKAFQHAAKKCNALIAGATKRKKSHKKATRKPGRPRKTGRRPVSRRKRASSPVWMNRQKGSGRGIRFDSSLYNDIFP